MEGYGGRGERSEPVGMTRRREREPSEAKEGSGWPLREAGEVHHELMRRRGCCHRCKPRGRAWACLGCSWGWSRARGEKRDSGEGPEHHACEFAHWSSRAAGVHASWGERREKKEGDRGVACRRRRGASSGALGRPEVAGGGWKGSATVRGRTVARSRACLWLPWHCLRGRGMPTHVW